MRSATIVLMIGLFWVTAWADPLPIRFQQLGVGAIARYKSSFDGAFADVYIGKEKGLHVLERREGSEYGTLRSRRHFNDAGLEVLREDLKTGRQVAYSPFNCARVEGLCTHTLRVNGGAPIPVETTIEFRGDRFHAIRKIAGADHERRQMFKLGDAGLISFLRENDTQTALTEIITP